MTVPFEEIVAAAREAYLREVESWPTPSDEELDESCASTEAMVERGIYG